MGFASKIRNKLIDKRVRINLSFNKINIYTVKGYCRIVK